MGKIKTNKIHKELQKCLCFGGEQEKNALPLLGHPQLGPFIVAVFNEIYLYVAINEIYLYVAINEIYLYVASNVIYLYVAINEIYLYVTSNEIYNSNFSARDFGIGRAEVLFG